MLLGAEREGKKNRVSTFINSFALVSFALVYAEGIDPLGLLEEHCEMCHFTASFGNIDVLNVLENGCEPGKWVGLQNGLFCRIHPKLKPFASTCAQPLI